MILIGVLILIVSTVLAVIFPETAVCACHNGDVFVVHVVSTAPAPLQPAVATIPATGCGRSAGSRSHIDEPEEAETLL